MATFSASDELTSFTAVLSGQYEVEREIGRGGMGVVYLARDQRLDRMVAIKTLPAALAEDARARERFLREARTAARLSHPNIVPIYRTDEINRQVFFVMGFVDGDSLAEKLAAGPLSPRAAVPILRDVASALGYAHAHGVIHRDVKTENILLETVTGRSMVTDFGIAHVAAATPLTATGQVLGTVYYLSPEQVSDTAIDARSDIYSLGVVGFVMLSGRFPFDGTSASAVLISHVIKTAPPLSSAAPHVPASLAAIIDRCLTKDPAGRFQSCAELDAALAAVRAEADAVATVPARRASPLLSDTEAQQVLGRAAELNDMTGARQAPRAQPRSRDSAADARREDGFKTAILRDAAADVGIDPKYVEQAFVEHGLRATGPGDRTPYTVHDLTERPLRIVGEPWEVVLETVVPGEVGVADHDRQLLALLHLTDRDSLRGVVASVGKTLTWEGVTPGGRELKVSVAAESGRTTIRVVEVLEKPMLILYGWVMGLGGCGIGALTAGRIMDRSDESAFFGAILVFLSFSISGWFVARSFADGYSLERQGKAREFLEALARRAREITQPGK